MRKTIFVLALFAGGLSGFAQEGTEKYAAAITKEGLKKQLTIVAGAEMEGRETATAGQRKAAAYIAEQFRLIGLKPAPHTANYQQTYPLFYDTITRADLTINNKPLVYGKDFTINARNNSTKKYRSKKIVFVGYGISDTNYNDYAGKNVRGKVVLMFSGEPKSDSLLHNSTRPSKWSSGNRGVALKLQLARKKGARLVLFVSPIMSTLSPEIAGARKTNIYYPQKDTMKMAGMVTLSHEAMGDIIGKEKFQAFLADVKAGRLMNNENFVIEKDIVFDYGKNKIPQSSTNVLGYIEGTDKKNEYVILTAHYDHIGVRRGLINYGADDDGSGTVSVIEMARAFAKAKEEGKGPRRTVIFMTVSGEEKGLWGSQYYSEHPVFPLKKTSVNLNTDMIGRIDPNRKVGDSTNYVYIIGDDKLSSELAGITDDVNTRYAHLELDRRYNDLKDPNRFYYRSDHYNFAKKGVPIIFYFDGVHADYHRPTDTVDKNQFRPDDKKGTPHFLHRLDHGEQG